jgi:flagellar biosynthetic protein FliR
MEKTSPAILELLSQLAPFLLTVFRLAGLFVFAPVLASSMVPARHRVLLVLMLGVAIHPTVTPAMAAGALPIDVVGAVPLLLREALIGFVVGVIAAIPMLSLEMSGVIAGQQMGLGLARVYNPDTDTDSDVLGQMLYTIALGGFMACGGLESLAGCVMDSFRTVPLGGVELARLPVDVIAGALGSGFELAIRVTTPVSGAVLLMTILLGVVGKTMPQINIMSVGFTFKIIVGLGALVAGIYAIGDATGGAMDEALRTAQAWVASGGGGGATDGR